MAFYPRVGCRPKSKPPAPRKPDVINAFGPMEARLFGEQIRLWLLVNETTGKFEFAEEDGTDRHTDVLAAGRIGAPTVESLVRQLPPDTYAAMQKSMKVAGDVRFKAYERKYS